MNFTADQLYGLLPAILRIRDQESGEPLRGLLAVLAEQAGLVEEDIAGLYDNWFIETCDEWAVPYIGDLLQVRGLHRVSHATFSQRAWVANTLSYRRRKGTAAMLEQLARDTTGWPARAVEFFQLLATSQHYNHVRLDRPATADVRRMNAMDLVDTAFDSVAHSADVRHIESGRGRHNIPNVGLFLWRLQSYSIGETASAAGTPPLDFGSARAVMAPADGRYRFNPLGLDAPLFNPPQSEEVITHLADERNVPGILRRRALHDELEALRQAQVDGESPPPPVYFVASNRVLRVFVEMTAGAGFAEILPDKIAICNLADPPPPAVPPADWRRPADTEYVKRADGSKHVLPIAVAVDPQVGRIAFPAGISPNEVRVCYSHGFPGDVGGNPYFRLDSIDTSPDGSGTNADSPFRNPRVWQVGVSRTKPAVGAEQIFTSLNGAVKEWNQQGPGTVGVIAIMDSLSDAEDPGDPLPPIEIKEGAKLLIIAADWPAVERPDLPGVMERKAGDFVAQNVRAHYRGDFTLQGIAAEQADGSSNPGEMTVNGIWLEGRLSVADTVPDPEGGTLPGNLGTLNVVHCTLVPDKGGLVVSAANDRLSIAIQRSICGPIQLAKEVSALGLRDSIVDAGTGAAIDAMNAALAIDRCTVFGSVSVETVSASNSIFTAPLVAIRRQSGCVRFCYLADGSRTPRHFACQPDLALQDAPEAQEPSIRLRLTPQFTSIDYGHPAYAQLALSCARELREGAEDGSEMGVWSFLLEPQRLANLSTSLDEYLRFGLEAGTILVT